MTKYNDGFRLVLFAQLERITLERSPTPICTSATAKTQPSRSWEHWRHVHPLRFREVEHDVHVLDGLAAGPLDEVVHGHEDDGSARQPIRHHVHEYMVAGLNRGGGLVSGGVFFPGAGGKEKVRNQRGTGVSGATVSAEAGNEGGGLGGA